MLRLTFLLHFDKNQKKEALIKHCFRDWVDLADKAWALQAARDRIDSNCEQWKHRVTQNMKVQLELYDLLYGLR